MKSNDLTREQARALKNKIGAMLNDLSRLQKRMRSKGFPECDPLLQKAVAATNAVHALHVELHYLTCNDVTGRRRESK